MTFKKGIKICSLGFLLLLISCGKNNKTTIEKSVVRPVKTTQVELTNKSISGNYPAKTSPVRIVNLSFRKSGKLEVLNAVEGKQYKKGDLIAQLDSRDFEIDLDAKKAVYTQKKSEIERYKRLLDKGSIPLNDYELKAADFQRAASNFENSKNALEDTKLFAPFDGTVGTLLVENYQDITANQTILSLIDLSSIEVEFFIPESQLFDANDVKEFEITFDASPERSFVAKLKEVGKVAQAQGFPVTLTLNDIVLENPKYIKQAESAGFTVRVGLVYKADVIKEKLVIPISAIFQDNTTKKNSVWILNRKDMTVTMQHITTGDFVSDSDIEVIDGLEDGVWIVTAGKHQISEGQKVKDLPNKL